MTTRFKILFVLLLCSAPFAAPAFAQGLSDQAAKAITLNTVLPAHSTKKTSVLFAHGFGGTKTRRLLYTKGYERFLSLFYHPTAFQHTATQYLFDRQIHNVMSFNFKDVQLDMGVYGSVPNPLTSHLAQQDDIEKLYANLENISEQPIIGFGVSRGAATWITTLGSKNITKNLAVVILESPFATVKDTYIHRLIGYCLSYVQAFLPALDCNQTSDDVFGSIFQTHNLSGLQPLDVVDKIDKKTPILLVHSDEDDIIPINQSRELYIKLKESGHEHLYLLEIEHGEHAGLIWGPQGDLYRDVVHAVYKKYNLPCNDEFANKINLNAYRPSAGEVRCRINKTNAIPAPKKDDGKEDFFSTCLNIFM